MTHEHQATNMLTQVACPARSTMVCAEVCGGCQNDPIMIQTCSGACLHIPHRLLQPFVHVFGSAFPAHDLPQIVPSSTWFGLEHPTLPTWPRQVSRGSNTILNTLCSDISYPTLPHQCSRIPSPPWIHQRAPYSPICREGSRRIVKSSQDDEVTVSHRHTASTCFCPLNVSSKSTIQAEEQDLGAPQNMASHPDGGLLRRLEDQEGTSPLGPSARSQKMESFK